MTDSQAPLLAAESVSVVYPGRRGRDDVTALDGVELSIARGEIVVLLGASGCGKSTLLGCFAGFHLPTRGRCTFAGEPITGIHPARTMIFQSYALFPWKTVRGNVELGPKLRGIGRRERREIAERYLELVGIADFADAYPDELSGGMRQRVAMCRALANDPQVILCDEPFAALDAMTRQHLQGELLRLVATTKTTVVFVTHSLDEALLLGDRIAVMTARPGRIRRVVTNPLPHPRTTALELDPAYLAAKRVLWDEIQPEVARSGP